jgi:hypothetical protein
MIQVFKVFSILCCVVLAATQAQTPRKQFEQLTTARLAQIPDFVLPAIYKDRTAHPLPATVDNSKLKYFPPTNWSIDGWSCANGVGTSYCYDYEVNNMMDTANGGSTPKYTYEYTYHLFNSGNQSTGGDGWMYIDCFEQFKKTGGLRSSDFGGFEWGNQFGGWASGYDKYYRAMKVRALEYYKIDVSVAGSDELVKQYLYDHGDQSAAGGLLAVQVNSGNWTTGTVSGRRVFNSLGGGGGHALSVCGYDDNFNGGSYLLCNNWGDGFYWAKYSLFKNGAGWYPDNTSDPFLNNKYFMCVRVRKDYTPKITFKVSLTHNQRNQISILTGAASSSTATAPTTTMNYYGLVNYTGGSLPMCGGGQSSTIELGLDLTDFNSVLVNGQGTLFLQVVSKGGSGQVNSLSVMDYTGATVKETPCAQTNVAISGTITLKVPVNLSTAVLSSPRDVAAHQGNGLVASYKSNSRSVQFTFPGGNGRFALLQIRDINGRTVLTKTYSGGVSATWDLRNNSGQRVGQGAYIASVIVSGSDGAVRSLSTKVLVRD